MGRNSPYYWLILAGLTITSCQAEFPVIPESSGSFPVSMEDSLQSERYVKGIDDFFQSGSEGRFIGEEGISVYFRTFLQETDEKGAIVVSTGRTEGVIKYKELLFDLFRNGYSLYIHDHRGQGFSGRMTADREMGYVSDFNHYVADLHTFYETIIRPAGHSNLFLLAHSMGGGIGMSFLLQYPGVFDAAALSSPMLGVQPYVCPLARILPGNKIRYGPGQSGFRKWPFEDNSVTHSRIRFDRSDAILEKHPDARLGGASLQWAKASCAHFRFMSANLDNLETPLLLLSGEEETVVNPRAHIRYVHKILKDGKTCEAYLVPGARHELFMEIDEIRTASIGACLEFFANY